MTTNLLINQELNDFYNQTSEEDRLTYGLGPLEFERNKSLISRFLPEYKCKILDVGGGTGKYSEWLANLGHEVWLIDPVEKHIEIAKKRSKKLSDKFYVMRGEARHLEFEDNFADLIIMHGPLYHLQEKTERQKAISEARRVIKPGNIVLGFAINYTASTIVGLLHGVIHDKQIFDMCYAELTNGKHDAPKEMPGVLVEAYYHRPEELKHEFEDLGFHKIEMFAVEGIVWLEKNYFTTRGDKIKYQNLQELIRITEGDMNLIALSPHMMIKGIK